METKSISDALTTLVQEVTELKRKTAIFSQSGGMFHFRRPANQIPPGFAEVVDWPWAGIPMTRIFPQSVALAVAKVKVKV